MELDPVQLWKLSGMVVRATFIPCFVEAAAVAVLSHFLLGFPWTVGFMLGFVLAAVSPAVIIPCLMSLSERGYGVAKVLYCSLYHTVLKVIYLILHTMGNCLRLIIMYRQYCNSQKVQQH